MNEIKDIALAPDGEVKNQLGCGAICPSCAA